MCESSDKRYCSDMCICCWNIAHHQQLSHEELYLQNITVKLKRAGAGPWRDLMDRQLSAHCLNTCFSSMVIPPPQKKNKTWLKPTSDPFVVIYVDCWFTAEHLKLKRQKLSSSVKTKQLLTCSENAHCGDSYLDEPLISSQV